MRPITVKQGEYFGWMDSIYRAEEDCTVSTLKFDGKASDIMVFDLAATTEEVNKVSKALLADMSFFDLWDDYQAAVEIAE